MAIDMSTPEGRLKETRNVALLIARKNLEKCMNEVAYLIGATPTSERRDKITEINIHLLTAQGLLNQIQSEE